MKFIPLLSFSLVTYDDDNCSTIRIKLESAIININVPDKINKQGQTIEEIERLMIEKYNKK
jgi:hypothetical protein